MYRWVGGWVGEWVGGWVGGWKGGWVDAITLLLNRNSSNFFSIKFM